MKATLIMERAKNTVYFFDSDQQFLNNFSEKRQTPLNSITPSHLAKHLVVVIAKFVEFSALVEDDIQVVQTTDGEMWHVLISGCFAFLAIDQSRSDEFLLRKVEMLNLVIEFLIGPTLFTTEMYSNCNLRPEKSYDKRSAWATGKNITRRLIEVNS